ncbi:hypothetical protein [Mycobacterium leprae]|uniref:hypothetical protein n=1 Tax=Mycobacterium leprae TaxID=1769 RepID=UPI00030F76BA
MSALVWTPTHLVAEVRTRFSDTEAFALNFDIMSNASPQGCCVVGWPTLHGFEYGTERYVLDTACQAVSS